MSDADNTARPPEYFPHDVTLAGVTAVGRRTADAYHTFMDNPSGLFVYLQLSRRGEPRHDPFELRPTRMEYVSSVTAADMLRVTVRDPHYALIDHPLLHEDLKTEVEFRFGYNDNLSDTTSLLFFRQKPTFGESGVETTLTFYDKGLLLMLPTLPRLYESAEGYRIDRYVEMQVEEVNRDWGTRLTVDFGHGPGAGAQGLYEGRYYRMHRPAGSRMQFIHHLRELATPANARTDELMEVFVEGDVLHFRPSQKHMKPIMAYKFFDGQLGARLLRFEPEVNLNPTPKQAAGVENSGHVVMDSGANAGDPTRRIVLGESTTVIDVAKELLPAPVQTGDPKAGEAARPARAVKRHTVGTTDTLQSIAARYNLSEAVIADENDLDPERPQLRPGEVLVIPQLEPPPAEAPVSVPQGRVLAKGIYLKEEEESVKARATVLGDPDLRGGWPLRVRNVGRKWSGLWYVQEASHTLDEGGYRVELELVRGGVTRTEGMEENTSRDNNPGLEVVPRREQQEEAASRRPASGAATGRG